MVKKTVLTLLKNKKSDKKTTILKKIQQNIENRKKLTINPIQFSNIKTQEKKSKSYDKFQVFIQQILNLKDDDLLLEGNYYENSIIEDGYLFYIKNEVKDIIKNLQDEKKITEDDNIIATKLAEENWKNEERITKLFSILSGFGNLKDTPWGIKKFLKDIKHEISTEITLRKFLQNYLDSGEHYDYFFNNWFYGQKGKQVILEQIEEEERLLEDAPLTDKEKIQVSEFTKKADSKELNMTTKDAIAAIISNRKKFTPFNKEEKQEFEDRLDFLNKEIKTLEGSFAMLQEAENIRKEYLNGKSDKDIYKAFIRLLKKKSIESIIKKIINIEFNTSVDEEKKLERIKELETFSEERIRKIYSNKQSKLFIIKYILSNEFYNNKKQINNNLFTSKTEQQNIKNKLENGKFVQTIKEIKLTYDERIYKDILLKNITSVNTVPKTILLKNITSVNTVPETNESTIRNVLLTLDENQINIIASNYGIKNPEKRGKNSNINNILLIYKRKEKTEPFLVQGKNPKNFKYEERKEKLKQMEEKELKALVSSYGFSVVNKKFNELIEIILKNEENISKLITMEEYKKEKLREKISSITKEQESTYMLLSMKELEEKLSDLANENDDYREELEKERLYKKLSTFVDITLDKYKDFKNWSITKLKQKLLDIGGKDWEKYQPLIEDYRMVSCMQQFSTYNWIKGRVTGVWITTAKHKKPNGYVVPNITIQDSEEQTWYQANKKFFSLQCNKYKNNITQKGDVLTCYNNKREKVEFIVGFTVINYVYTGDEYNYKTYMVKQDDKMVNRTLIIQNEKMFNNQKLSEKQKKQTDKMKIQYILNSPVTEKTESFIKEQLSDALLKISPLTTDYGINETNSIAKKLKNFNTPYIQILLEKLKTDSDQTNKQLLEATANIIIYLQIPEAKIFKNNIIIEYYLPDTLANLSPMEKFPEVFEDPEIPLNVIDQYTNTINNNINKFVDMMGSLLFDMEDPVKTKRTLSSVLYTKEQNFKTNSRISACENKDRVKNSINEEIVYYKDKRDDKIYCFTINELLNQFMQGNIINPETGENFDTSFVERFGELYNKKLAEEGLLTNEFIKKYEINFKEEKTTKEKRPEIGSTLFLLINKDLEERENQLDNKKEKKSSMNFKTQNICEYCKKHLIDDSLKTIRQNSIVKFCSINCFEKADIWHKEDFKLENY